MQDISQKLLSALRNQIGALGRYNGQDFELIEVLEHEPALVLRECGKSHTIQDDLHGEAHRIVSKTHTVSIFSEVSDKLHPVLEEFFPPQTLTVLHSYIAGEAEHL
ncbi:MAG: hypothetical protein JXA04_01965 [Gammaproteobacteria bacterium]|nr:hypothetical protein [Gammaproteobacteria bacterium]